MARSVPKLDIMDNEAASISLAMRKARLQGKQHIIIRKSDGAIVESLSGKSHFPSRAAATCALAHLIMHIVDVHGFDRIARCADDLARRGGSCGPRSSLIMVRALLETGVIEIREA